MSHIGTTEEWKKGRKNDIKKYNIKLKEKERKRKKDGKKERKKIDGFKIVTLVYLITKSYLSLLSLNFNYLTIMNAARIWWFLKQEISKLGVAMV